MSNDAKRRVMNSINRLERELARLEKVHARKGITAPWVIKCMRDAIDSEKKILREVLG